MLPIAAAVVLHDHPAAGPVHIVQAVAAAHMEVGHIAVVEADRIVVAEADHTAAGSGRIAAERADRIVAEEGSPVEVGLTAVAAADNPEAVARSPAEEDNPEEDILEEAAVRIHPAEDTDPEVALHNPAEGVWRVALWRRLLIAWLWRVYGKSLVRLERCAFR